MKATNRDFYDSSTLLSSEAIIDELSQHTAPEAIDTVEGKDKSSLTLIKNSDERAE